MADPTKIDPEILKKLIPNKSSENLAKELVKSVKEAADAGCASGRANVTFSGSMSTSVSDGKPRTDMGISFRTECVDDPAARKDSNLKSHTPSKIISMHNEKTGSILEPAPFS